MSKEKDDFKSAAEGRRSGLVTEMIAFMKETNKWWLFPIFFAFLVIGALVLLTATPAAPFIYTMF